MFITLRKVVGFSSFNKLQAKMLVSQSPVSFLGDVDVKTGVIVAEDSDIRGECIKGKIFAFPYGRGSTVGTYVLLQMKKLGTAPAMIINRKTESILAAGTVISDIPLADKPEPDLFKLFKSFKETGGKKLKLKEKAESSVSICETETNENEIEVEVIDTGENFLMKLVNP